MTDSVEIRTTADGKDFECDWGVFTNPEANPRRECGIQPLILITPDYLARLIAMNPVGPIQNKGGGTCTANVIDGKTFVYLYYRDMHWRWEIFEAHWWDGSDQPIMVGKWPT